MNGEKKKYHPSAYDSEPQDTSNLPGEPVSSAKSRFASFGERISGAAKRWANPESTLSPNQRAEIQKAEQRAKFNAIKNARVKQIKAKYGYNPKKPGTGWGGNILDSMGAAANREFSGKGENQNAFFGNLEENLPKQQKGINPLLNETGGFGGPILDEGGLRPIHLQQFSQPQAKGKKKPMKVINIY